MTYNIVTGSYEMFLHDLELVFESIHGDTV
jgi:hypothetical protein